MLTIQHKDIPEAERHEPKTHEITSHAAVAAGDRNKMLITDPLTGVITFSDNWPQVAGDPISPAVGSRWYDTTNNRFRVCLNTGLATVAIIPDE